MLVPFHVYEFALKAVIVVCKPGHTMVGPEIATVQGCAAVPVIKAEKSNNKNFLIGQ
jgi:hypothetical protein